MDLNAFLGSLTQDERKFIAERDYGVDADVLAEGYNGGSEVHGQPD